MMVLKAILDPNEVLVYRMVIWGKTYDKSIKQKTDYKVLERLTADMNVNPS